MRTLEPQQLIASSTLFHDVYPDEAAAIIARLQPVSYAQATCIIEQGVWHGQFYIIASGYVRVLLQVEQESALEITIGRLGPGECFGEISLITGKPPSATICTEEDTTLWSLSQRDFLLLIQDWPTLPHNINHILSQYLVRASQHILFIQSVERVWLAFLDHPNALLERSLAFHITQSLAEHSWMHVLAHKLFVHEPATVPRLATHTDQVRSSALTEAWTPERAMTPLQVIAAEEQAITPRPSVTRPSSTTSTKVQPTARAGLTAREVEVLSLVAQGFTDVQVAEKLVISPRTVNWHLTNIYDKIHVPSRSAATRYALEHHIA